MKKLLSILLVATLLIAVIAIPSVSAVMTDKAKATDGQCGESLSWSYDAATTTLNISGTGDMFNYSQSDKAPWYDHRNVATTVTLAEGVTSVGAYAFYGFKALATVNFASSVALVNDYAFYSCDGLTEITIPATVKKLGAYALSNCKKLASITLSEGIEEIGAYSCSSLPSLTTVTVPGSVKTVGEYAFSTNTGLTSVVFSEGVEVIGKRAFSNCIALTDITFAESVTTLGEYAFRSCAALKDLTLTSNINNFEVGAFAGCTSLESVKFVNGNTTTGEGTFNGCTSLTNVELSSTVETIDDTSFYGCSALEAITIPASVTAIGEDAFSGCLNLLADEFVFEDASKLEQFSYSDIWNSNSAWVDHVISICRDTFSLFDSSYNNYNGGQIDLTGFDTNAGSGNADSNTWIDKSAKFTNEEKTEAQLRIDFSYLPESVPTDIVFVLDYSGSMKEDVEGVSKIYTLASKVDDISRTLLTNESLDNRIAIVPFSENYQSYLDFTDSYDTVHDYLFSESPDGDTHYSEGFQRAYDIISSRNDPSRDVIVVFVTDGAPNVGFEGGAESTQIKKLGISIAGIVLDTNEDAYNKVSSICSKDMTYKADSNDELNTAINKALITSFVSYLVLDNINTANFSIKDVNSLRVVDQYGNEYNDTVKVSDDLKSIIWDTSGYTPAVNYTLLIDLIVLDNIYGTNLTTNDGAATVVDKDTYEQVNNVTSPELNNISAFTVTYNSNRGGEVEDTNILTFNAGDKVTVAANSFTNTGFGFAGWNTKADGTGTAYNAGDTFTMPKENVTLYAQWNANSYTVTYNGNGGKADGKETVADSNGYAYNATVVVKNNMFSYNGYTFTGWNTKADGTGTAYSAKDTFKMPTQSVTLYAQWTSASYKVTYNSNAESLGGKDETTTRDAVYASTVTVEDNMFKLDNYTFKAWNTKADGTGKSFSANDAFKMPAQDVVLYAQWEKKEAPKTGLDASYTMLYIAFALASISAIALAIYKKKAKA